MNQYLILAVDFTDSDALERRMKARPFHIEMVKKLKASGNFTLGGAILNENGQMIGSSLIVQFETDQQLSAWLAEEPYLMLKVWEKVDIKPFQVAEV
ncbi:MAG: hypothetical protein H7Y13_07005 [Sphingobacteriaceae bacterium]|nr:hypothetical protein [Sphingobacteriaceae bacterium]